MIGDPIRILIQLIAYNIGGTERRFSNILRASIDHSENQYFMVINRYLYRLVKDLGWFKGIEDRVFVVPKTSKFLPFNTDYPQLRKRVRFFAPVYDRFIRAMSSPTDIISRVKPDIIHIATRNWWNLLPLGIPRLIEVQNNVPESVFEPYIRYHIGKPCIFFHVASNTIRKNLLNAYPDIQEDTIFYIPFTFTDLSKTQIGKKEKIVTYLGKFNKTRGAMLGIKTAIEVLKNYPDVKFYFLGHGEDEKRMREIVNKYRLADRITIMYTPNPYPILSRTLIYLALAKYDNYHSQALLEAMASGCAVVATDVGETYRMVDKGNGVLVEPNPSIIAKIVIDLLDNFEKTVKLGLNSAEKLRSQYNMVRYIKSMDKIYRDIYNRIIAGGNKCK